MTDLTPKSSDEQWFDSRPDRTFHVRRPRAGESAAEFEAMGDPDKDRRWILLRKAVDQATRDDLLKITGIHYFYIPFSAASDDIILDNDRLLERLFNEMVQQAIEGANQEKKIRKNAKHKGAK